MSWYKKAQAYSLGTSWPQYHVDEQGIMDYIAKQPSRWVPVDSSFIKEVSYHPGLRYFDVRLRNGRSYTFANVPQKVYDGFMKAKSKGEFFNRVVKNKYSQSK